jgi:hypothetical protein
VFGGAPVEVTLPYFARFVGTTVVDRPRAYLVPPALGAHLRQHGLIVTPAAGRVAGQVATVESVGAESGRGILEAARVGELQVSWRATSHEAPEGWMEVATDQPLGAVAVYLCEPESDDGAVENGLIDAPAPGQAFPVVRLD